MRAHFFVEERQGTRRRITWCVAAEDHDDLCYEVIAGCGCRAPSWEESRRFGPVGCVADLVELAAYARSGYPPDWERWGTRPAPSH